MEHAEPTPETTPEADAAPRSCANCGAGMAREQDWCLECGTAAPGRIGGVRPGWRAVTTTLALTLVLVGGAGAASYAALSSDASQDAVASAPTGATPVAQAPPVVAAPAAPVVAAPVTGTPTGPTGATTGPTIAVSPTKTSTVPVVAPPAVKPATTAQVTPTVPATTTPAKTTTTKTTTTPSTTTGDRGSGTNATGTTDTTDTSTLTPISLGADAVSVYDPYKRAVSPGDPADAYDGDTKTTFTIGAPDDQKEMQVGIVVDLESAKQVKGLQFTTTTPGGRVEVYATNSSMLPPDVLDTRWEHPASRSDVDGSSKASGNTAGDGVEKIVFPKGGAKYRYVLLWFTTPPKAGPKVGITELKVLG